MKKVRITFKNGKQIMFDNPEHGFDVHRIIKGVPIIFDNLWIDTEDIMIIEVKENGK